MIGIYKITEKENPNMFYIGKSNNIERRFKEHIQKSYAQSRIPFDDYISKKGKDAFNYEILEECSLEELNQKKAELQDRIAKMIMDSDVTMQIAIIEAKIQEKKEEE